MERIVLVIVMDAKLKVERDAIINVLFEKVQINGS